MTIGPETATEAYSPTRPKRGHGEGTIYQRKFDGRWVGYIMLGRKSDGRPDRPKVTGKTRRDVQRQLAELKRKSEEGLRVDPSKERQTIETYMESWLAAARTSVRPQTWEGYRQFTRTHIAPTFGRTRLSALRPDTIQAFYADKLAAGLAPNTVKKIHSVFHRALKMAVKWGYLPRNPTDDVDKPTAGTRELRVPDPSELKNLIECAVAESERAGQNGVTSHQMSAAKQWAVLWTLAVYSGCREGELLGLTWPDVDLERCTLTVRRTLVSTHDQTPRFGEPKSQTSRRTISLAAEAVEALRAHKKRQGEQRLAAAHWADHRLVFCTQAGTPLMRRNVLRAFKTALVRAGLPQSIRFHDLRHSHGTMMMRAGVPLKVASARLGHSGIGITADLYQHVASDMDADAAERTARACVLEIEERLNAGPRQRMQAQICTRQNTRSILSLRAPVPVNNQ